MDKVLYLIVDTSAISINLITYFNDKTKTLNIETHLLSSGQVFEEISKIPSTVIPTHTLASFLKSIKKVFIPSNYITCMRSFLSDAPFSTDSLSDADISLLCLYRLQDLKSKSSSLSSLNLSSPSHFSCSSSNSSVNSILSLDAIHGDWWSSSSLNEAKPPSPSEPEKSAHLPPVLISGDALLLKTGEYLDFACKNSFKSDISDFLEKCLNGEFPKKDYLENNETEEVVLICRGCRKIAKLEGKYFCSFCGINNFKRIMKKEADKEIDLSWKPRKINIPKKKFEKVKGKQKNSFIFSQEQLERERKVAAWNKLKEPKVTLSARAWEEKRFGCRKRK